MDHMRELNLEIRKVDKGLVQENQIFIRGVGESSLFVDELEWTVQVLDNQVFDFFI